MEEERVCWLGWSKRCAARKVQAIASVRKMLKQRARLWTAGLYISVTIKLRFGTSSRHSCFRSFANRNQQRESKQALLHVVSDFNHLASYIAKALSEGEVNCYYCVFGRLVVTTRSKRMAVGSLLGLTARTRRATRSGRYAGDGGGPG